MAVPATMMATRPDGKKLRGRILRKSLSSMPFSMAPRCSGVVGIANTRGWPPYAESALQFWVGTCTWHRRLIMGQKARKNHAALGGKPVVSHPVLNLHTLTTRCLRQEQKTGCTQECLHK